ncbi:TIGR01244 family sulfur transferase [Erythrobacter sp. SD-21]|uniref:TIGR01244 family sulfur transferase n=1 Tax=Erythrobacter sp. SD-21 TaxID=161528 RepID=UPI000153F3C7|nr:TIGR01244 family sulfur transferase [Erythrobacter sp. SD-21]EDL48346.1 hypothetical protein ED21_22558 [Erythrobacter sp. SD-21]
MDSNQLTDHLCVRGQVTPEDVAAAKDAGFTRIVCNRPDGEAEGQPDAEDIREAAEACGLTFSYIPVSPGGITPEAVQQQAEALREADGKVLAYYGSGKRATVLWALCNPEGLSVDERLERAKRAGHDLSELRDRL